MEKKFKIMKLKSNSNHEIKALRKINDNMFCETTKFWSNKIVKAKVISTTKSCVNS